MELSTYILKKMFSDFDPVLIGSSDSISFNAVSTVPNTQFGLDYINAFNFPKYEQERHLALPQLYVTDYEHLDEITKQSIAPAGIICGNVSDTSIEKLHSFSVPILALVSHCSIEQLYQRILFCLFALHQDDDLLSRLTKQLISGASLDELLMTVSNHLHRPLLMIRRDNHLLAQTLTAFAGEYSSLSPSVQSFLDERQIPQDTQASMQRDGLFEKLSHASHPLHFPFDNTASAISTSLFVDEIYVGTISLFFFGCSPSWRDYYVMSQIGPIFSSYLKKSGEILPNDQSLWGDFMRDLIYETTDARSVAIGLASVDVHFSGKMVLIQIRPRDGNRSVATLYPLQKQLEEVLLTKKSFLLSDSICLIAELGEDLVLPRKTIKNLQKFLIQQDFIAGISNIFSDILSLKKYYEQTQTALAVTADVAEQTRIFQYQDYFQRHLLSVCSQKVPLESLCSPAVTILQEYDKKHGTNYLATLRVYIESDLNISKASQRMSIHYNTMKYRLNTIFSLTGVDLSKINTISNLCISFLALDTLTSQSNEHL